MKFLNCFLKRESLVKFTVLLLQYNLHRYRSKFYCLYFSAYCKNYKSITIRKKCTYYYYFFNYWNIFCHILLLSIKALLFLLHLFFIFFFFIFFLNSSFCFRMLLYSSLPLNWEKKWCVLLFYILSFYYYIEIICSVFIKNFL